MMPPMMKVTATTFATADSFLLHLSSNQAASAAVHAQCKPLLLRPIREDVDSAHPGLSTSGARVPNRAGVTSEGWYLLLFRVISRRCSRRQRLHRQTARHHRQR